MPEILEENNEFLLNKTPNQISSILKNQIKPKQNKNNIISNSFKTINEL
jgi:hypothetical protein